MLFLEDNYSGTINDFCIFVLFLFFSVLYLQNRKPEEL